MRVFRFIGAGLLVACALLVTAATATDPSRGQSDAELEALNRQVEELIQAGKYREAMQIAQQYVVGARQRYGEEHPENATAIGWLGRAYKQLGR